MEGASVLAAQTHDHVDARNFIACRHLRHLGHVDLAGDVEHLIVAFDEIMMVLVHIGVEIGLRPVHGEFAQQADFGELVQRVVDRRQRHRHFRARGPLVEHFRGQVAVALAEQDPAERHALPRRTQAHLAQHRLDVVPRAAGQVRRRRAGQGRRLQVPQRVHRVRLKAGSN